MSRHGGYPIRSVASVVGFAAVIALAVNPVVAQARIGQVPSGGKVLSFAHRPLSVSVQGSAIAWSSKTKCPSGLKRCYRGQVRVGSKTVPAPSVLDSPDIDLGNGVAGLLTATYVRCTTAASCGVYEFDPAAKSELLLPLRLTPDCRVTAPRVSGLRVAYIQSGKNCSAPGLYVADAPTGLVVWEAWKTGSDLEAAHTDELTGDTLYWSTLLAGDSSDRTAPDHIFSGNLDTRTFASIARGNTYGYFGYESFSVAGKKLFYLLDFSGDEQGASESAEYQALVGKTRRCEIKGLGTNFDPAAPGSLLFAVAAQGPYLYVVLSREDSRFRNQPNRLIRYRLSALKQDCRR